METIKLLKTEVFADPYVAAREEVDRAQRKERGEVDQEALDRYRFSDSFYHYSKPPLPRPPPQPYHHFIYCPATCVALTVYTLP